MAISFNWAHFPHDIFLMGMRWYGAYPFSHRHVEEPMEERHEQAAKRLLAKTIRHHGVPASPVR
jgi:transposase-like protein